MGRRRKVFTASTHKGAVARGLFVTIIFMHTNIKQHVSAQWSSCVAEALAGVVQPRMHMCKGSPSVV